MELFNFVMVALCQKTSLLFQGNINTEFRFFKNTVCYCDVAKETRLGYVFIARWNLRDSGLPLSLLPSTPFIFLHLSIGALSLRPSFLFRFSAWNKIPALLIYSPAGISGMLNQQELFWACCYPGEVLLY